ncbi:MAG: T9SS type A sorting domain-containing protein [Bacteroidota bacterium]
MQSIATFSLTFLASISLGFAGELVLSGAYQGKDVFVQNPYNRTSSSFCTEKVFVNDRLVLENPKVSAFKIDLSYLSVNDLVVIRIEHKEGCRPTIINQYVLKTVSDFKFLSAEVDNNSIRWTTFGEKQPGTFTVERETRKLEWSNVGAVNGKQNLSDNLYALSANHKKGENKYRIRYQARDGFEDYSLDLYYTRTDTLITFRPTIVTSQINLSDSTAFKVLDFQGKLIKQGSGSEILLLNLKPGEYFLEIQNRREKFIKK